MKALVIFVGLLAFVLADDDVCSICSCSESVVNCRSRNLTQLPEKWKSLATVDLSLNRLYFMDKTFQEICLAGGPIRRLDLRGNVITGLEEETSQGCGSLQSLDLSHNKIGFLQSDAFRYLSSLRSLDLSNNQLTHVDTFWFGPLKSVIRLDLSENPIGTDRKNKPNKMLKKKTQ